MRNSTKVIIILAISLIFTSLEKWLEGKVAISSLLAIVSMASLLKIKSSAFVAKRLSQKFGKLWIAAEVILFVLVGSAVDIRYTLSAGFSAIILIVLSLFVRAFGVVLSTILTDLSLKERLFCVIAYLPKATVQAAIGAVPMTRGLSSGKIILSVAVLSILITAPFGKICQGHKQNFFDKFISSLFLS